MGKIVKMSCEGKDLMEIGQMDRIFMILKKMDPRGMFAPTLVKLLKISLFIGPKRPRGKSSNCHINWLARAYRSILVTKFRADVLVPLSHSAAHNRVSNNYH